LDVIDIKTGFLLASQLILTQDKNTLGQLIEKASVKAGKTPVTISSEDIKGQISGIPRTSKNISPPRGKYPVDVSLNAGINATWKKALKERTSTLRRLKNPASVTQYIEGFSVFYNYLRQFETAGKTPAEMAEVVYFAKSWLDIILRSDPAYQDLTDPKA